MIVYDEYYKGKTIERIGENVCDTYKGETILNVFNRFVGDFNTVDKIRTGNRKVSRFVDLKLSVVEKSVDVIDSLTMCNKIKPIKEFSNSIKLNEKYTYKNKY